MTLIPVSKISTVGWRSWKLGGSRWIGHRSTSSGASFLSIGSPTTFHRRPSVASPTGTVIGPPVSTTSAPRARPSVESIATARTRSSPRCCCTSATRSIAGRPSCSGAWTRSAVLISGSVSGKTASITTPLISMILPTLRALPFDSGMRLLKGGSRGRTGSAKALHKPRQCIEARGDEAHAGEPGVLLERRHPGGVVEASAVRRDEPERDGRGGRSDRPGGPHEREPPAARKRDRLLRELERGRPHEPGRGHGGALERLTPGAAGQMRLQHLLREL